MNERIRVLAEQATTWEGMVDGYYFDKEKFAQLIVQECANVGSNIVLAQTEDNDMGVFLGIKKYFGVEL